MSDNKDRIMKLIKSSPSGLQVSFAQPAALVGSVREVLTLHRQSKDYELTCRERSVLKDRLIFAAARLQGLVEYGDSHRGRSKEHLASNLDLLNEIATELGLEDPQHLQQLTLERV